jgi:hypothetical protein
MIKRLLEGLRRALSLTILTVSFILVINSRLLMTPGLRIPVLLISEVGSA